MKKNVFSRIGRLTLVLSACMGGIACASPAMGGFAFQCGAYLRAPAPDAMTVMWLTSGPSYSWVEYGPTDKLGSKADATVAGLRQANNTIQRICLTDLKPATTYHYRVCSKQIVRFAPYKVTFGETIRSPIYTFKTPDDKAGPVRVAVFNDIHGKWPLLGKLWGLVADRDPSFVVLNGDILSHVDDESRVVNLLDFCSRTFAARVPFVYARGNHETRGAFARLLKNYLALPDGRYYYAFTRGCVRFIVLDSGEDKADDNREYAGLANFDPYREAQRKWLAKEVQSDAFAKARYRVVIHHIPPYQSGNGHGPTDVRTKWSPLYNAGKVDLVISGHTHRYGLYKPDPAAGHDYALAIGGAPKEGQATVIYLQADEKSLHLQMIRDDGKVVGEFSKQPSGN